MMMGVSWIIPVVVTTFSFEVPHRTASPQRLPHHSGTCVSQTRFKKTPDPRYGIHRFPCDTAVAVTPVAGEGG